MVLGLGSGGDKKIAWDLAMDIVQTEMDNVVLYENGDISGVFFLASYQIYKIFENDTTTGGYITHLMKRVVRSIVGRREFYFMEPLVDPLLNKVTFRIRVLPKPKVKKVRKPKDPKSPNKQPDKKEVPEKKNG